MIIEKIIVHCAASPGDISAAEIREIHMAKGWRDIGYHFVIRTNGTIETGRPVTEQGAHTYGQNPNSLGICLAGGLSGKPDYTKAQWRSLEVLILGLLAKHNKNAGIYGHNDFTNRKTCPNFDVGYWWSGQELYRA